MEREGPRLRRLRPWAVGLPLALLLGLELARQFLLAPLLGPGPAADAEAGLTVVGVLVFSAVIWRLAERAEDQQAAAYRAARADERMLVALHEAALSITAALDLGTVLQRVVDTGRGVLGARYGAVAVLGNDGAIEHFVTSGLDAATLRALGGPPTGHGLLGLVIEDRRPLLVDEIQAHPRSVGFPPGHPRMRALLAVPVVYQNNILGSIYVADREDGQPFSVTDQESLERFAAQVAIAVANARLYGEVQRLSLVEERERISMDLHDGVLQSLYATALGLEAAIQDVVADPPAAERAVTEAIERLHATIRDIRHYIFDLRATQQEGASLSGMLEQLLEGLRQPGVDLVLDAAPDSPPLPRRLQWEAWHVAREAVSNALRHSGCRRVALGVGVADGALELRVEDDGRGFDTQRPVGDGHRGLANMRRRAAAVGGSLTVASRPGGGTAIRLRAALPADAGARE